MKISENTREVIEYLISRKFISGICLGIAAESFRIMSDGYDPAEQYYLFLVATGCYLIAVWWYPIWIREKEQEHKNKELIGSVG